MTQHLQIQTVSNCGVMWYNNHSIIFNIVHHLGLFILFSKT